MHYFKHKKDKFGVCNICLNEANLTWDHVPPKGGVQLAAVEMQTILQRLTKNKNEFTISQNGVKYRTICKKCNEFLGSTYDKAINEFARTVSLYIKSNVILPETILHKIFPNLIVKGILAHLLSAKAEIDEVDFDEKIRKIVLDKKSIIPSDIHVFYWIYPYEHTIIIRDSLMPSKRGKFDSFSFFHMLKYFPIAYLVSDSSYYQNLPELTNYCTNDNFLQVEIPIKLKRVENYNWPEVVDNSNIFIGGKSIESSIIAKPRLNKK